MTTLPTAEILKKLGLSQQAPTAAYLDDLLLAWAVHIPWETASRMARHQQPGSPADYARQPEQFFADALQLGTGGTCFESNQAFAALLAALRFDITLSFCSMETSTIEPHCAVIVTNEGVRYLADVGYPVPAALPLTAESTRALTPAYTYHAEPLAEGRWHIQRQSDDFRQTVFWVDINPIAPERFRQRLLRDHEPDGLFLDEVIIHSTEPNPEIPMKDWSLLRYNEGKGLVRRSWGCEELIPFTTDEQADLPATLARLFGMDKRVIASALHRQPPDRLWEG